MVVQNLTKLRFDCCGRYIVIVAIGTIVYVAVKSAEAAAGGFECF